MDTVQITAPQHTLLNPVQIVREKSEEAGEVRTGCPSMGCDWQAVKILHKFTRRQREGTTDALSGDEGGDQNGLYPIIIVMEKLHAICALFYLFTKSTITFNSFFALAKTSNNLNPSTEGWLSEL